MRSVIVILVGAAVVGVYLDQAYSGVLRPQQSIPTLLASAIQLGLVALIAFLIGLTVTHRGWLAATVAYLAGLSVWVFVDLRPSPPWVPTDVGGTWEAVFMWALVGGAWSALFGAAGSWSARARRRRLTRRPTGLS